ncbi:LysR family transcriptional regulator [Sphingobium sp. DC-2]|uniref:LysR family transcriptional regulator n=1 Tax=Sphingobium sp. DC-2 TaxID=1303256 RepID=UPI00068B8958|nr:LysR family transcriptional regulator [Sphingobium sp. DC-2]
MHFEGFDLNLLVSLDALLTERNVTRASEKLRVSQPAMSAALQKLRVQLSDPLLERIGRQMELTPRGKAIAGPVKDLLFGIRGIFNTEASFDPETARHSFRIVMSGYCAEVFGVPLVHAIGRLAPHVTCEMHDLSIDMIARLREGQFDMGVALPHSVLFDPDYANDGLCTQRLFIDHFVLVGSRSNPALAKELTYDEFCEQPYVDVRIGGTVISLVEQALRRQSKRPPTRAWAPSFLHAMAMASQTELLTMVPARMLALHADALELKAVPAPLPVDPLEETAIWHPRTDLDPAHLWLREVVQKVAAKMNGSGPHEFHGVAI